LILSDLKTKNEQKVAGFILIKCTSGYEGNIFSILTDMGSKIQSARVKLTYDIVVKVFSNSSEEFREIIKRIRTIPNIMTSTILYAD